MQQDDHDLCIFYVNKESKFVEDGVWADRWHLEIYSYMRE